MEDYSNEKKIINQKISKRNNERINNIPPIDTRFPFVKVIIVIIISIMIIGIAIALVFIIKNKNKKSHKTEEEEEIPNPEPSIQKSYSFIATYQSTKDKQLKIFNPNRLGLNEDDYLAEEIIGSSNLRRLESIEINNGIIIPNKTGIIKIKVTFENPFTNLDFMFEGCIDIISIDLSNINSPSITSMIYTFTNCKNLQKVDFTSLITSHVTEMDFLFAGCSNLIELKGLENLNTSSLQKTAGMFIDCGYLSKLNLSAFQLNNVEEQSGMFINNPSLQEVDLGNCSDVNKIFSSSEDFNLVIISRSSEVNSTGLSGNFSITSKVENIQINCTKINFTKLNKYYNRKINLDHYNISELIVNLLEENYENEYYTDYIYGYDYDVEELESELEKCYECNPDNKSYCGSCFPGYYVLLGIEFLPTKCKKCDEGCILCHPDNETDLSYCTNCSYGYELYNGKCIKRCQTNYSGEMCLSCNNEDGKYDQCLECNIGYYFDPNYNTSKCRKIEINNCISAKLENNTLKCKNCSEGYMLYNNECYEA